MKTKLLNVQCIDIFVALFKKRKELETEYSQNPTRENRIKLESLLQQILLYEAITRDKPVLDFLN